jgi:hypothetical protein
LYATDKIKVTFLKIETKICNLLTNSDFTFVKIVKMQSKSEEAGKDVERVQHKKRFFKNILKPCLQK